MFSTVSRSALALAAPQMARGSAAKLMANGNLGNVIKRTAQHTLQPYKSNHERSLATESSVKPAQLKPLEIDTERTPNPEAVKFLPGRQVLEGQGDTGSDAAPGFFVTNTDDRAEIARSPLAETLFDIKGVKAVFLGDDFVTVTKEPDFSWDHVRNPVFDALQSFYASEKPALKDADAAIGDTIEADDSDVVAMIKELLEVRIRPTVQQDGGDIRFVNFDESTGTVEVSLAGSCVGCPSSTVTLKNGVERMLKHYIEEVKSVAALEDMGAESMMLLSKKA